MGGDGLVAVNVNDSQNLSAGQREHDWNASTRKSEYILHIASRSALHNLFIYPRMVGLWYVGWGHNGPTNQNHHNFWSYLIQYQVF